MQDIYTLDAAKGRTVLAGRVILDEYVRDVTDAHYMRKLGAYGIQADAFATIADYGTKYVLLRKQASSERLYSAFIDWVQYGVRRNYGHGDQIFLQLRYMHPRRQPAHHQPKKMPPIGEVQQVLF